MIWAPVRVTAGIGMLAPVNGYCTAQMLLVQIWLLGFGMANTVWTATVQAVVDPAGNTSVAFVPPSDNAKNVLKSVLAAEVCAATVRPHPQGSLEVSRGVPIVPASGPDLQGTQVFTDTTTADGFASVGTSLSGVQWDYGPVCGTLTLPYPSGGSANEAAERAFSDAVAASVRNMIGNTRSAVSGAAAAIVAHAGRTQANQGQQPMTMQEARTIIGPMIEREAGAFVAAVRNAATAYWNTVDRPRREAFHRDAQNKGWASAGVFYMTISRMSAQVIEKSNVTLTVRGVDPGAACPGVVGRTLGRDTRGCEVGQWAGVTSKFLNDTWDEIVTDSISAYNSDSVTAGSDGVSGFMGAIFGPLSRELLQMQALDPARPLESMVNRGHWILGVGTAALGAYVVFSGAAHGAEGNAFGKVVNFFTGGVSAMKGALMALSPLALLILGAVFMYGVMNAYVLPMMPFIMWSFAVGSVVILFIESVVAASVWAFVHVRMDGQEFADGAQRAGYMLAFNAFMRPTLSIFGLILGMAAFSAMSGFVDQSFPYAFQGAMANHFVFIIGWLTSIGMMIWLQWHFALRSFSMCHMLPDRVAAWMGASGANLGEEGEFSAAKGAFMNAANAYGAGSVRAASDGMGRAAQMRQQARIAEGQRDRDMFDGATQISNLKAQGVNTTAHEKRFEQKFGTTFDNYLSSNYGAESVGGGTGGSGGGGSGSNDGADGGGTPSGGSSGRKRG
jgi:conjugal transfer/type IV secretion protein DotA/TraY